MKRRIPLIAVGLLGLTAFSVAQDTETTNLVTWLCTSTDVAQDPQIRQALKIRVGVATHEDVVRLMGRPWRAVNDADCDATEFSDVWEYLSKEPNGAFRIHVAFGKAGKVSLVARIPQRGKPLVLAYAGGGNGQHVH